MRVLMSGGGTAGHVNPALAIAETIKRNDPDAEIEFVCSMEPGDKAADLVPKAGYMLHKIKIIGAVRPLYSPKNVQAVWLMQTSKARAKKIIREFKPDIIIGTGGFACWPVLHVGARMGIPTLVHESNAYPGLAIRMLKKDVDRILVNFPDTAKYFGEYSGKVKCCGNPFMDGFRVISREDGIKKTGLPENSKYVLAFGGSGGAERFNYEVLDTVAGLTAENPDTVFAIAAGKRYYGALTAKAEQMGLSDNPNVKIYDYIYDMPYHMAAADLVICRAGAMTLSEVALTKRAAVMIPSPNVTDDHQRKNAGAMQEVSAGMMVEESEFGTGALENAVRGLLADRERREFLGQCAFEKFANPDANKVIYEEIISLLNKKA